MRLTVKQKDRLVSQSQFIKGPVHIGRHPQSQIFLPHPSVSRQHLVLFLGRDGRWSARVLQSANRTFLNGEVISESALQSGDRLKVGEYTIDMSLDDVADAGTTAHLEDTHAPVASQPRIIARDLADAHAPPMRMPAHRARDFYHLTHAVAHGGADRATLNTLLDLLLSQFQDYRVWTALRCDPQGYTEEEGGRTHLGEIFVLEHAVVKALIEEACQKQ